MNEPTTDPKEPVRNEPAREFARAADEPPPGIVAEFWEFLVHNKKWWLAPILLALVLLGLLVILGGSPAAPFIYTLW